MRLKIEPPGSKRVSNSQETTRFPATDTRVLSFILHPQQLSNWCWAALASSLGHYYGTSKLEQPQIVSVLLSQDCSRYREDPETAANCNKYAMLDEALQLVGCYSHWSPEKPAYERIMIEIDAGRPVCLCLEWRFGGTHYVVITGYFARTGEIYIEDPLHGPSVQPYDSFPGSYRLSGGFWRGTYWTQSR